MAGRAGNTLETSKLTLSTNPRVVAYLEALVQTGFYGKNPSEAAEQLVRQELKRLVDAGELVLDK